MGHSFVTEMADDGLGRAPKILLEMLLHPQITQATLREVVRTMVEVEESRISIAEYYQDWFDRWMNHICTLHEDPDLRAELLSSYSPAGLERQLVARDSLQASIGGPNLTPADREGIVDEALTWKRAYEEALANFEDFEADSQRVIEALVTRASIPYALQPPITSEWVADLTDFALWDLTLNNRFGPVDIMLFQHQRTLLNQSALRRLLMALCLDRLGEDASHILDPFTEQPLHWSDDRIWSIGVDSIDQGGEVECVLETNIVTQGDIVAPRQSNSSP